MLNDILKIEGSKILDKETLKRNVGGFDPYQCVGVQQFCAVFFNGTYQLGTCENGVCVPAGGFD